MSEAQFGIGCEQSTSLAPSGLLVRTSDSQTRARQCPASDPVLSVGDRVADVLVQQVVADEPNGHFARAEPGRIERRPVAEHRLQQVIARGRRLADGGDIVLRESMQQVIAREPVGIAPEQAATHTYRRNARDVGAVAEGRAYDIELVLDAPDAAVERPDVQLALEFAATESGVALRIGRLVKLEGRRRVGRTDASDILAGVAGQPTENEAVELGVVGRRLRTCKGPVAFRNPISIDLAVSMPRLGLPISNVTVASCAPRETTPPASVRVRRAEPVMLATSWAGRSWIRPTLALFGVKLQVARCWQDQWRRVDVQLEHLGNKCRRRSLRLTRSIRPAICALVVSVNFSSLKT